MLQIFMYRRNNINNGILSNQNAMPQKDATSDGAGSFATGRHNYVDTVSVMNATTQPQKMAKKWYGNRDSSTVTANRRYIGIGKGSYNDANVPTSFTNTGDNNMVGQALSRVRRSGYVVPPKCVNTKGTAGVQCYGGIPMQGTIVDVGGVPVVVNKPNKNTDRTRNLLTKRDNLGCDIPYDCLNKSTFCKTQC
jgi:hypothetical protein